MTKPEGLLELVERLDHGWIEGGRSLQILQPDEWPRLRDSIVALTEFVEGDCFCSGEGTPFFSECGPHLLLRGLDNPTPKEPRE